MWISMWIHNTISTYQGEVVNYATEGYRLRCTCSSVPLVAVKIPSEPVNKSLTLIIILVNILDPKSDLFAHIVSKRTDACISQRLQTQNSCVNAWHRSELVITILADVVKEACRPPELWEEVTVATCSMSSAHSISTRIWEDDSNAFTISAKQI